MGGLLPEAVGAEPKFNSYELKSKGGEILSFDFDGDRLNDIIVIDEPNLVFFFQDPTYGFAKNPNLVYSLVSELSHFLNHYEKLYE